MKKTSKALIIITAVILMTAMLFSVCVSADYNGQYSASGYFGELNWKFSKSESTLIISGEGRMAKPAFYDYWYTYASFARYVVIEEGVENISGDIMSHSPLLETVTIPDSVTEIDENAFYINEYLTIKCNYGSYAAKYAEKNSINVEYLDFAPPCFEENGLQLKISNLSGVKHIRVAYGDYNTIGQISRAEGERTFTARDVLKGREEYTVQFRNEGLVSVAVCYNNGYIGYYKYNVTKKAPVMIQEGNTVTFTELDSLKVIRYVKGEYESSYDIKRAGGSVAISGKTLTADSLSVSLTPGTYTFCVQYDDESYNYYRVNI